MLDWALRIDYLNHFLATAYRIEDRQATEILLSALSLQPSSRIAPKPAPSIRPPVANRRLSSTIGNSPCAWRVGTTITARASARCAA